MGDLTQEGVKMAKQLCTRKANGMLPHSTDRAAVWSGVGKHGGAIHLCANCRAYDLAREHAAKHPQWKARGSAGAISALAMLRQGPLRLTASTSKRNQSLWHWVRTWTALGLVQRQGEAVFALAVRS